MKKVILVGDSIRIGYQDAVREHLKDVAEVWGPTENGGNSRRIIERLDEWIISRAPDIVHINCGLHDLRKEFNSEEAAVPLAEYEQNLKKIFERLKTETRATMIWASTTPVNEKWHHAKKPFDRFEADVAAYNDVADRLAAEAEFKIHNLFQVVQNVGRDTLMRPDGVHYLPEGYAVLAKAVANCIREVCG